MGAIFASSDGDDVKGKKLDVNKLKKLQQAWIAQGKITSWKVVKSNPPKRRSRASKRKEDDSEFPERVVEFGRHKKSWLRVPAREEYRLWKNALFIGDNVFITGPKRGKLPTMYHICNEGEKYILYSKVDRDGERYTKCEDCGWEVPKQCQVLAMLQKLKP